MMKRLFVCKGKVNIYP